MTPTASEKWGKHSKYFSSGFPSRKFLVKMTRTEDQVTSKILGHSKLSVFIFNIQSLGDKTHELFVLLEELSFPEIVLEVNNIVEPVFVKNYTTISFESIEIIHHQVL